jgi:phosphoribosylformylglycinamidine cyclo-ligase
MTVTYEEAGVDLQAAADLSHRVQMKLGTGLFGGFVPVDDLKEYEHPVLVSSVDGIGTKTRLAASLQVTHGLGRDIVHHCVNDIAVHGATPLFFVDYLAFHRLDSSLADRLVDDIDRACSALGISLAGGETAEMPAVYREGCFDVAGAIVGVVERGGIVDGSRIRAGDALVGLPSSGPHTSGYSLIQALFGEEDLRALVPELGNTLGDALLASHRCYLGEIRQALSLGGVHGLAHITGGGIVGNLSRIMPAGLQAAVELPPLPLVFRLIQDRGVSATEMRRVFNLGIGLIAVCDRRIVERLPADWRVLGHVVETRDDANRVVLEQSRSPTSNGKEMT